MSEMGTYNELLTRSASFASLLEDINQHQQEQDEEQRKREQRLSSMSLLRQVSKTGSMYSTVEEAVADGEQIDDPLSSSLPTNLETKQEGTVKWHVYLAYLRAGVGAFVGLLLMVVIFSSQQTISLLSNWWLARWSNDESHRHRNYSTCHRMDDGETNRVRAMTETEWNNHRNQRFYTQCGEIIDIIQLK